MAIESVFTALNMKTALRLAEVRGVVLLAAAQAGIPSFSYSPREVKATVAGYGHAGKEQVQQMVRALLRHERNARARRRRRRAGRGALPHAGGRSRSAHGCGLRSGLGTRPYQRLARSQADRPAAHPSLTMSPLR